MSINRNNQPPGNRQYVTPIVTAESSGRTGDVFAPPYMETRATPADHTVEEELYDWSGADKQPAPPAPHFKDDASAIIWAWRGIIFLALVFPIGAIGWILTVYLLYAVSWGIFPLVIPLAVIIAIAIACSLNGFIHSTKSNQPILTLSLSLLGIAIGAIMLFYLVSNASQWQVNIELRLCGHVPLYNCNPR